MSSHRGTTEYDPVAKSLHWLVFILMAVQFGVAWTMPEIGRGTEPVDLIAWHLSIGAAILLVVLVRLLWRVTHAAPPLPAGTPDWQRVTANLTHLALYALLVVLPLLGWANASSRGWDVHLFSVIPLPALMAKGSAIGHEMGDVHAVLANVFLAVLALHVLAALYHQFIRRDQLAQRMMPGRRGG